MTYAPTYREALCLLPDAASWGAAIDWECDGYALVRRSLYAALVDARSTVQPDAETDDLVAALLKANDVPPQPDPCTALRRWERMRHRTHQHVIAALGAALGDAA